MLVSDLHLIAYLTLSTANYKQSNPSHSGSAVPASAFALAGTNMRQFDLEVDVVNEHALRYVAELNALTRKEYLITDELAKVRGVLHVGFSVSYS